MGLNKHFSGRLESQVLICPSLQGGDCLFIHSTGNYLMPTVYPRHCDIYREMTMNKTSLVQALEDKQVIDIVCDRC